jgi:hypothetical protein
VDDVVVAAVVDGQDVPLIEKGAVTRFAGDGYLGGKGKVCVGVKTLMGNCGQAPAAPPIKIDKELTAGGGGWRMPGDARVSRVVTTELPTPRLLLRFLISVQGQASTPFPLAITTCGEVLIARRPGSAGRAKVVGEPGESCWALSAKQRTVPFLTRAPDVAGKRLRWEAAIA